MRHLLISFIVLFYSCHSSVEKKVETRSFSFTSGKKGNHIKIENKGNSETYFSFLINKNNFNSEDEILEKIKKLPDEFPGEPLERKAWRFVADNLDRCNPLTSERWQHSPLLMINSVGFGICDDFASVLSFIWKKQGFQSRVWGLEGHVVPEVFVNNKWQMYDPLQGVYYLNSENEIAGVEELSASPEYITNPRIEENVHLNDSLNFFSIIRYSKRLSQKYSSVNDNKVNEWYDVSTDSIQSQICLPPAAVLEFPIDYPSGIFTKGFLGEEKELRCLLKITLPKNWTGKINFPFVVCSVKGKGTIEIKGQSFELGSNSLIQYLKEFSIFNNEIIFKEISENAEVYCLLNPLIFKLTGTDSLELKGANLTNLSATLIEGNTSETISLNDEKEKIISRLIQSHYAYYKTNQVKLDNLLFNPQHPMKSKDDFLNGIKIYFAGMTGLISEERKAKSDLLINKAEKLYQMISLNNGNDKFVRFINDPVTFIMFVSVLEVNSETEMAKILQESFSGII